MPPCWHCLQREAPIHEENLVRPIESSDEAGGLGQFQEDKEVKASDAAEPETRWSALAPPEATRSTCECTASYCPSITAEVGVLENTNRELYGYAH